MSDEISRAPPVVELDRHGPVTLVEPPSLLSLAVGRTGDEAAAEGYAELLCRGAASLRGCWPPKRSWPVKPPPRAWRPGVPILVYGADVWEDLRKGTRGSVPFRQLSDAVIAAYNYATLAMLTEEEVQSAVGFSEGPEEE